MHDDIDLSGCCKMLHDISSCGLDVDSCTMMYWAFRRDKDVTIAVEGEDYTMKNEDAERDERFAIGILILAGILSVGGFLTLLAMLLQRI